jgi:FkbM family methyltransferase
MTSFEEQMRYEYPLSTDSLVVDVGGYEGKFANLIHQAYGCSVDVYEPIPDFYDNCVKNNRTYPIIRIFNFGLGGSNRIETFAMEGDKTGSQATGQNIPVEIKKGSEVLKNKKIDLLKINIEGMEYELLEDLIENNIHLDCQNIQVQFHKVGKNFDENYDRIRNKLLKTHETTYDFPFVWTNFKLK